MKTTRKQIQKINEQQINIMIYLLDTQKVKLFLTALEKNFILN